ncbi:MAG: fructose-bisphosphatase class III [Coriobacteriaceae bacterium]
MYLIADKAARKEVTNPFYSLLDDDAVVDGIFRDFGMDPATSRIICGHVPVKVKDGEDPVKAGGRVLCIDGGFSAAYQKTTGLAGFTLVSNAEGLFLDANEPLLPRRRRGGYCRHPPSAACLPPTTCPARWPTPTRCLRERIALLRTLL